MADGTITIGCELDTKSFDKQISDLENKIEDLEKQKIFFETHNMKGELQEVEVELEKTKNKLVQLNIQKDKLGDTKGIDGLGKSLEKSIKNAGRLVLGIFGIRSAYMAMRRASSDLAGYDQQYAANLEYIRFVLTQMIAPVLRWIVNLAGTLLSYLYAILNAWFGIGKKIDVGAKSFQKMKAGAGGVSKAVKEIKKQLTGFDELNVLTADGDVGGAGGVGTTLPNFDVGGDIKIPSWLQWIIDNKDLVLTTLAGIVGALTAMKFGLTGIQALGIATMIVGIIGLIKDMLSFIKNPSWAKFGDILMDISVILAGLALVTGRWEFALAALITSIAGVIIKLLTKKDALLSVKEAEEKLKQVQEELRQAEEKYANAVDRAEQSSKALAEAEKRTGISGKELYNAVQNGTIDYKNMNEAQRDVYKAYLDNIGAQDELRKSTDELNKKKKEETQLEFEKRLELMRTSGQYDKYKDTVVKAYKEGRISAEEAQRYIGIAMAGMSRDSWETFEQDLPKQIRDGLDPRNYQSWAERFKYWWNNTFLGGLTKILTLSVNSKMGSSVRNAKGAMYIPAMPLATGGLVNLPGRGYPLGSAVAGERGVEGVIPLTDQQAMAELGREIGRWITINANIPVNMNGRIISRELRQVQNEQDFAYNT